MYGNIIVAPSDPEYWSPVNRELVLVLDDILLQGDKVAPFSKSESNRTAMGRYGNVMLVNGQTAFSMEARRGEVVRLYVTNTANVRPFNFSIPGARMKLVGGDGGRIEDEQFVADVLLALSERAIIEVLFEQPGELQLKHTGPDQSYTLGTINVHDEPIEPSYAEEFETLRSNLEFVSERAALHDEIERAPDKILALVAVMPGMQNHGGGHGHDAPPDIEWEDTMPLHNRMTTPRTCCGSWSTASRVTRTTTSAGHSHRAIERRSASSTIRTRTIRCSIPSTFMASGSWYSAATACRMTPALERHRPHPHGRDGGPADRNEQPRAVDGTLPYCRTPGGRNDAQLRGP